MVKIWKRQSYGPEDIKFDVSYLSHPTAVTNMHWRKPWHAEQNLDNLLYTICADNKIRIWSPSDQHALSVLHIWNEIDMHLAIQPRKFLSGAHSARRYGFIVDSRDFSIATEKAVQSDSGNGSDHALEHLVEVATRSPEICVVLDGRGHMSAWGLEHAGCKNKKPAHVFNIAHVEGVNISFGRESNSDEDYAQFCTFSGGISESSLTVLVHYYDGRINWFDAQITKLFDTAPSTKRVHFEASWSGHDAAVKKIIRSISGSTIMSRTDSNHGVVWKQTKSKYGPAMTRQSSLDSEEHIHRSTMLADGRFVVNLHHRSISLWDTQTLGAHRMATQGFKFTKKPLCLIQLPNMDDTDQSVFVAAICADMTGVAWQISLPLVVGQGPETDGSCELIGQFCDFQIGSASEVAYVMPVDPAGSKTTISGFFDIFAADIAIAYSTDGTLTTLTAKVDTAKQKVEWLVTAKVETGIANPSLVSGSSIRKAALIDRSKTTLTIWDTVDAQLEYEECFSKNEIIQDLDWTSTPDDQSILAVGFPHRILLLSQLRYNYLSAPPAWTPIREVQVRALTAHPVGDSCWLSNGNLVIGAGNQLFVYDRDIELSNLLLSDFRPHLTESSTDLFQVVRRLNGSLPVFHPQFIGQCILSGKTDLVHKILVTLHKKLKFWSEGDEIDSFLDLPLKDFILEGGLVSKAAAKEMRSSYADFLIEEEDQMIDEEVAALLKENLINITLPQISSREQFYLADIVECVAAVETHRRSMDDDAARYYLFFRQHMLTRSQAADRRLGITWREIVWGFHSGSQDILVDLVSRSFHGKMLWEHARESGMFMWISDVNALRAQLEVVARNEYTKTDERNPADCSIYYLALRKKSVLQGLWRMAAWNREQTSTLRLLANNFHESRWKTTAKKNAYALLSKRRFEYAAAFFLLGDALADAVNVCAQQLKDIQLAVTIARAYGGDNSPILHDLITHRILPEAAETGNRWMATWAFWMLNKRDKAVRTLVSPIYTLLDDTPDSPSLRGPPGQNIPIQAKSYLSNDPALVVLYRQLREKTLQTLRGASMIKPREEWEFIIRNARLYSRMGCDLLALDLTRNWEFLIPPPPPRKRASLVQSPTISDPRKLLRRRSSLVVDDMPHALGTPRILPTSPGFGSEREDPFAQPKATAGAKKPPPTVFEEPDASSLLDSFGF